jgi:hypothetical protein
MSERSSRKYEPTSAEQVAELTDAVLVLTEQVRCLRLSIDEIEQELGWTIRAKVLDRLPRSGLPCDANLLHDMLVEQDYHLEHAMDVPTEEPPVEPSPFAERTEPAAPATPSRQSRLW